MIKSKLDITSTYSGLKITLPNSNIVCETWDEIKEELFKLYKQKDSKWIFRGLKDSTYRLKTSLERKESDTSFRSIIFPNLLGEFISSIHNFLDSHEIPEIDDYLEWISMMQHHGAPTNLLDWTYSPYIASFFSVQEIEKSDSKNNCCIWALNETTILNLCKTYLIENKIIDNNKIHPKLYGKKELFIKILDFSLKNKHGFILPVNPRRKNERLLSQQGTFTFLGNIKYDFEYNLIQTINYAEESSSLSILKDNLLKKIVFSSELHEKIKEDLFLMNITARTLFRGIDGYSSSLCQYMSKVKSQLYKF